MRSQGGSLGAVTGAAGTGGADILETVSGIRAFLRNRTLGEIRDIWDSSDGGARLLLLLCTVDLGKFETACGGGLKDVLGRVVSSRWDDAAGQMPGGMSLECEFGEYWTGTMCPYN